MSQQLKRTVIVAEALICRWPLCGCDPTRVKNKYKGKPWDKTCSVQTEEFTFTGSGQPRASQAKFNELRRAGRNPKLRQEIFTRGKWIEIGT